jgi:hypothetical protein
MPLLGVNSYLRIYNIPFHLWIREDKQCEEACVSKLFFFEIWRGDIGCVQHQYGKKTPSIAFLRGPPYSLSLRGEELRQESYTQKSRRKGSESKG